MQAFHLANTPSSQILLAHQRISILILLDTPITQNVCFEYRFKYYIYFQSKTLYCCGLLYANKIFSQENVTSLMRISELCEGVTIHIAHVSLFWSDVKLPPHLMPRTKSEK